MTETTLLEDRRRLGTLLTVIGAMGIAGALVSGTAVDTLPALIDTAGGVE